MKKKIVALLAGSFVIVVVASGCKSKKAGASCTGEEAVCADKTKILECHDGKFVEMACKGPKGCSEKLTGATTSGRAVTHNYAVQCDFTGNAAGETCTDDGSMCSADKKAMVSCKDKKIEVHKCLGAKGCSETATTVDCDATIQALGEPCEGEDVACTEDKKQFLRCKDKKMIVGENCRGPKGCSVSGQKISCDAGEQTAGDACAADGNYACATDKKAVLKCASGKWTVDEKCRKSCVTKGDEVGCG